MFFCKDNHCIVEHKHIIQTALLGAFTFVMYYSGSRVLIIPVTSLGDAIAQIDVLAVHEEGFVEQTDFIEHLFPNKHKSACQYINHMCFVLIQIPKMVSAE